MKNNFLMLSLLSACGILSAQGYTGINNESPKAALDVKTAQTGHEVMRVSTIPISVVEKDKPFILLAGEAEDNGYNVRHITTADFFDLIKTEIPSLRRITITNSANLLFPNQNLNVPINLRSLVSNSDTGLFRFDSTDGSIEILETGYYDVSSWIGVNRIPNVEEEFIVSLAKKRAGSQSYENFKRAVITRSNNNIQYNATEGIGASFAFVDKFEKGDKLITVINAAYTSFTIRQGEASLTVSRVDKVNRTNTLTP